MRPFFDHLPEAFIDGPIVRALRYLPPPLRPDLYRMAQQNYADADGNEPTVMISVRVPVSLAVRLDIEKASVKRALHTRRATRSTVVRYLLGAFLAQQDQRAATSGPAATATAVGVPGHPAAEQAAA